MKVLLNVLSLITLVITGYHIVTDSLDKAIFWLVLTVLYEVWLTREQMREAK
ncbi:hypothetical protein [Bacillus sp. Y1]|nr:hypothetical protein [Bacillus sp. Y1]